MLPRLLAGLVTLPLLVLVADIIGVFGGYLVGTYKLELQPGRLSDPDTSSISRRIDVVSGLVKAAVFGFIVALMGCYHGYHSRGGAAGRGPGDHQRGGLGLDPDPRCPTTSLTEAVLRAMSTARPDAQDRRSAGCRKSLRPRSAVLTASISTLRRRRMPGGHRRLGHRQVGR